MTTTLLDPNTRTDSIVAAVMLDGSSIRLPLDYTWSAAQARWDMLDEARRDGRLPGVAYLVVRSTDDPDPRWAKARPATSKDLRPIDARHPKGFASMEEAGKVWGRHHGYSGTRQGGPGGYIGRGGSGGWIYLGGRTVCQGWFGIASFARKNGHIQEIDGRWMVME